MIKLGCLYPDVSQGKSKVNEKPFDIAGICYIWCLIQPSLTASGLPLRGPYSWVFFIIIVTDKLDWEVLKVKIILINVPLLQTSLPYFRLISTTDESTLCPVVPVARSISQLSLSVH